MLGGAYGEAPDPEYAMLRSSALLEAPVPQMRARQMVAAAGMVETSFSAALPRMLKSDALVQNQGAMNATFGIEGLSTIPSNTAAKSETHKVAIAEIHLDAEMEWIVVPNEKESAFLEVRPVFLRTHPEIALMKFLQCQAVNDSQYVFLPGPASIFMGGNFVSKSEIGVSPHDANLRFRTDA